MADMNAQTTPAPAASRHRIANPWLRWFVYLTVVGCGLGIFAACGIIGGYLALNWLA